MTPANVIQKDTHKLIPKAHNAEITCLELSSDGSIMATGCTDGTIKVWDANSLQEIRTFYINKKEHEKLKLTKNKHNSSESNKSDNLSKPISCIAISYCNNYIAACSCDFSIKMWNMKAYIGDKEKTLTGHKSIIFGCKFMIGESLNQPMLVTGSLDRTIKFWKNK